MVKPSAKPGRGTTAPSTTKSSQKLVDALKGKTMVKPQGAAITKQSPITHSRSLRPAANMPHSVKTRSNSVNQVATASEESSNSGAGDAPATGQMSHSGT